MGMTWTDLTCEELCDLMCGAPELDYEDEEENNVISDGEAEDTE